MCLTSGIDSPQIIMVDKISNRPPSADRYAIVPLPEYAEPSGPTRALMTGSPGLRRRAKSDHPYAGLEMPDTRNATKIDYQAIAKERWDYPEEQRFTTPYLLYKDLDRTNAGLQAENWQNKAHQTWCLNHDLVTGMIGDRLEMTPQQRAEANSIVARLNLRDFGVRREYVVLAVCGNVLHNGGRRKCHYNCTDRDELFVKTCAEYGARMKLINSLYEEIAGLLRQGLSDPEYDFGVREYGPGNYINRYDVDNAALAE
jgi:hypothetical protein